jgi:hypothetical protein
MANELKRYNVKSLPCYSFEFLDMKLIKMSLVGVVLGLATWALAGEEPKPLYENNFEQAEAGKEPPGFKVVEGGFVVKADGTNKFAELPGAPLDTCFMMFDPSVAADVSVSARIRGTSQGRRAPTFAVGLNGLGGYKLQVSPAKKALELFKGEEIVGTAPFDWKSGEWCNLRLQIAKTGDTWKLEGRAWQAGAEPAQPLISYDEKTEPRPGPASVIGMPFASTPIQFDDLLLKKVGPAK